MERDDKELNQKSDGDDKRLPGAGLVSQSGEEIMRNMQAEFDKFSKQQEESMKRMAAEMEQLDQERQTFLAELKNREEEYQRESNRMNATIAVYEFVLELSNLMSSGEDINEERISRLNIDKIRILLNGDIQLEQLGSVHFDFLSRSELFQYFPVPTEEDAGYAKFYHKLKKVRQSIMLAQRFEITATAKLDDYEFNLYGGRQQDSVPEMSHSFSEFLKSGGAVILLDALREAGYPDPDEIQLTELLTQVADDVSHCILSVDEKTIRERSSFDEIMLLAPTIKHSAENWHTFSLSIYKNFCLIGDKYSGHPGITIYEIPRDFKNLQQTKGEIATDITKNMNNPLKVMTPQMFSERMVKLLKLKNPRYIALAPQYGDNCAWSSCAKTVLLSALYFRLYDVAIASPTITHLAPEQQELAAHDFAKKYARIIQKQWSKDDQCKALDNYIQQLNEDDRSGKGPGRMVLAFIYLKYSQRADSEHKVRIIDLIDKAEILTPGDLQQAKDILFERAVKLMKEEHPIIYALFKNDVNQIAKKFAELYMLAGKKKVEAVYSTISVITFSPFKSAMKKLDTAIDEARSKNTLPARNPAMMFSGDRESVKNDNNANKGPASPGRR